MAALPPVFRPAPSTATPRKSKLNTAAGSQVLVTRDQDRAAGQEANTEAGVQIQNLANPTPEKKRRSVAMPKQKQAATNNNGDNANSFDVIDEIV